ncbi:mitochondrial large ribosomal subunit l49 [Trichoderma arundinaceum]|uniref:Large ribosomal subunit protein mL49 n=1 Tax=Trichoderma arundinaceum TaxID=490622 RepID=A0A395NP88_TRIAR|nr:mitochondrial large ribosomal subunit l49 [Trichoderma arundinaceum]
MNCLISRALPLRSAGICRPAVRTQINPFASRNPFPSTNQAASISTKPSSRQNPNQKLKIPPQLRQLSRAPVPPPTKSPEELVSLGYLVRRTPSVQLPVYRRWLSGGTRQVVLIKKVDGDRRRLLEDIIGGLGIAREDVRINPTTQHIELKGDHFDKARGWLLERGF